MVSVHSSGCVAVLKKNGSQVIIEEQPPSFSTDYSAINHS